MCELELTFNMNMPNKFCIKLDMDHCVWIQNILFYLFLSYFSKKYAVLKPFSYT